MTLPFSNLAQSGCQYAFYYAKQGQPSFFKSSSPNPADRFLSASIIKVPILLTWLALERAGMVSRDEVCDLDAETQVQGSGLSWLLRGRQLPFQDVLLLMIALSDNLCTNLVIRRVGLETFNPIFKEELGLQDTQLQRKLFDYEARARGLDNYVSARDCIQLYQCIQRLIPAERAWVDEIFAVNQDDALLKRDIPRDTLNFHHKTGSITGVLHDWGYTDDCQIFLLTQNVTDEPSIFQAFGELGRWMIQAPVR